MSHIEIGPYGYKYATKNIETIEKRGEVSLYSFVCFIRSEDFFPVTAKANI